jgi:hypothetical protein
MVIPQKHAESFVDIFDALVDILQNEADYLPTSLRRARDELLKNVDRDEIEMWFRILKGDIDEVVEDLNEIISFLEEVEREFVYYEEHHADQ